MISKTLLTSFNCKTNDLSFQFLCFYYQKDNNKMNILVCMNKQNMMIRVQIINETNKNELYYIKLMRLGNQNTSSQSSIEMSNSIFLLKRIGNSTNAPYVQVDFSPLINTNNITPTTNSNKAYPLFNQDGHHFTPAFFLQEDQTKIQKKIQSYSNLHEERVKEALEQKQQIYVAKPSKANSFCSICRMAIEDYLTHLNTPNHQQLLRNSQYCKDIAQLCNGFVQKQKKIEKKNKQNRRVGRKCRTVKQDISQATYTTTSVMSIEQYNIQKIITVC